MSKNTIIFQTQDLMVYLIFTRNWVWNVYINLVSALAPIWNSKHCTKTFVFLWTPLFLTFSTNIYPKQTQFFLRNLHTNEKVALPYKNGFNTSSFYTLFIMQTHQSASYIVMLYWGEPFYEKNLWNLIFVDIEISLPKWGQIEAFFDDFHIYKNRMH